MYQVKVTDWATGFAKKRNRAAAQAHAGALAAAGYRLKQLTTSGMRQQAPGDVVWPKASSWIIYGSSLLSRARSQRRRLDRRKRAPKEPPPALYASKGRGALIRLAAAVRYQKTVSDTQILVRMGFLSPRLAKLAAYHTAAHTVPVTAKMRRLIFAVGLGISKTSIQIPARPAVGPVYRKAHGRIAGFAQARIHAAWRGLNPKTINPNF